jgi:hypothetical protein
LPGRSDRISHGNTGQRGITRPSALCVLCRYRHKTHWTGAANRLARNLLAFIGSIRRECLNRVIIFDEFDEVLGTSAEFSRTAKAI